MSKINSHYLTKITFLILCLSVIKLTTSCSNSQNNEVEKNIEFLFKDSCIIDATEKQGIWSYKGIIDQESKEKKYFNRTTKESPYGISYKSAFHSNVLHKNIKVVIEGFVRISNIKNNAGVGVSITQKDSSINWFDININNKITKENTWTFISDTIILPKSVVIEKNILSFFSWNIEGNGTLDVNSLFLKFIELKTPSFFPNVENVNSNNKGSLLYKNNFYSIYFSKDKGSIFLCNKDGNDLLKNITHYLEYKEQQGNHKTSIIINQQFNLTSKSDTLFEFTSNNNLIDFSIKLGVSNNGNLTFSTHSIFKSNIYVVRESIIITYLKEIQEVYTKNRKLENQIIQDEYWLEKEGFKVGQNSDAITLYHLPNISSLQLNTTKKQFAINLDYNLDHLRMSFPLIKDTTIKGVKNDLSCNFYKKGTLIEKNFSIHCGEDIKTLPRFMKNPNGYLSSYIFTEHADFSDIKTQRAVNYGSEDIIHYKNATGGFAKYKIPVTKSVFYHNPQKISNNSFNKKFNSEICNIKTTPNYLDMLKELYKNGFDICLHTPEENTTTISYLEEALAFFKTNFNSKSWIDHGYDNSQKNNREDFACDGFNKNSDLYAQPLYKKYNVKYFWNCYNEDSSLYGNYNFANNIKNPFIGFGDFIPTPNYSKHIINQSDVISWQATSTLLPSGGNMWDYYFSDQKIQHFINDYEVVINHCYPARVDSFTGFYNYNDKDKIVINQQFNKTLEKLAFYRDKGDLNTTTIKDFLDYNLAIENIDYIIINTNQIKLINNNSFDIKGLSMIINSNNAVKVNNLKVLQKTNNNQTIFWFDLKAKSETFISF